MRLDDFHHRANLSFVDDADEKCLVRSRIHTVCLDTGNAVMELRHNLLRELLGVRGNQLKFIAVFDTVETVVNHKVGNEEVEKGTHNGCDLHTVDEEGNRDDTGIHNEGNIRDIEVGATALNQSADAVCTAARAEVTEHQGEAKSRDNTRCDSGKENIEVLTVVGERVGHPADCGIKSRKEGLNDKVNAQHQSELSVDKGANENEDGNVEGNHQNCPIHLALKKMGGDGSKTADATGREAVAVLEEVVGSTYENSCDDSYYNVNDKVFDFAFHVSSYWQKRSATISKNSM